MTPVALAVAPVAAKAGVLAGAATAGEANHWLDNFSDFAHQVATTSFFQFPSSRTRLRNILMDPEIAAWNWLHAKWDVLRELLFGEAPASPDQARMVEYYAAACPHCKHLEPVWKEAVQQWGAGSAARKVVWQQRECLDEQWKPGKDFEECKGRHIQSFPTIHFYPPSSSDGDDFIFDRTPANLIEFAKTGIQPALGDMARAAGDEVDFKLVDFYSSACPHCKSLDPVWNDASKQWEQYVTKMDQAHQETPLVSFEKKECYDDSWRDGKDIATCQKFNIDSFPTVKLFKPNLNGHGFSSVDYEGPRSAQAINDFLKKHADLPMEAPQAEDAHETAGANSTGTADHATGEAAAGAIQGEKAAAAAAGVPEEQRMEPVKAASPAVAEQEKTLPVSVATAGLPLPALVASCLPFGSRHKPSQVRLGLSNPKCVVSQFL